jgi:hypothetical protein
MFVWAGTGISGPVGITMAAPSFATGAPYGGQKLIVVVECTTGTPAYQFAPQWRFGVMSAPPYVAQQSAWDYFGLVYNGIDAIWDVVSYSPGF